MKRILFLVVSILMLSSLSISFADENIDNWRYHKEIKHEDTNLYKSLFLDEEIYRYSKNNLSDIRIVNEQNQYLPYYIYNEYINNSIESLIEHTSEQVHSHMDTKYNKKYIDFKVIPNDENIDILGSKIILDINKNNFLKKVEIYGGYDNIKWDFIKEDTVYRINDLEKLDIQLNNIFKYTYYRIIFLDDMENTIIDNLKLIYNHKEITYREYTDEKNAHYEIKVDSKEQNTIIYLNNENSLKLRDISIISKDAFKRKYSIFHRNNNQEEFKQFSSGEIYQIDLKNFKATKTNINLGGYENYQPYPASIKIVIYNNDDVPINIDNIKTRYLVDKIVFKGDGTNSYKILFGNMDAHRPSYDIEAYKDHIENEDQELCTLLNIVKRDIHEKKTDKEINYNLILNITIVVISILLVLIIIKKIKF